MPEEQHSAEIVRELTWKIGCKWRCQFDLACLKTYVVGDEIESEDGNRGAVNSSAGGIGGVVP